MSREAAESQGRQIVLATDNVPAPNAIYLTQDDALWLYAASSLGGTLRVVVRILLPDGSMSISSWDFFVSPTRVQNIFTQPLSEGFLLGIHVYDTAVAYRRGQCYASINVQRDTLANNIRPMRLVQGYVSYYSRLYWPGGGSEDSLAGLGNIRSITGATPAAGSDFSETVPGFTSWRLIALSYTITTSATVASRATGLLIDDGTNPILKTYASVGVPAGTVTNTSFAPGLITGSVNVTLQWAGFIDGLRLAAGFRIRSIVNALQAGDQITQVQYMVEEWLST